MNRREILHTIATVGCVLGAAKTAQAASHAHLVSASDPLFRQGYCDADFGQLYYWTAGHGPNLVLVHQSDTNSEEFARLVPLLADKYRMIAMDLPGHGRSDDPASEPTVDDYTRAVTRLLDELGVTKAHVLGHHGGARTAMNLAANEPDRFDKVILSGTGRVVRTPEESVEYAASLRDVDRSVVLDGESVADALNRYIGYSSENARPEDIMRPFITSLEAKLRPYSGLVVNVKWDRRPALNALRGPVLLVQGGEDKFVTGQESLLSVIPDSTRIVMPGCGTFMFYDKPKECADMISDYLG